MPFYAVAKGRTTGILLTWPECQESVKGFSGAIFKKFDTKGDAEEFINSCKDCHKDLVSPDYYVYTDGACSQNGKEGACAGIGVYFGEGDARNISRRVQGKQTNNVAELMAILAAYDVISKDTVAFGIKDDNKVVAIVSDSEYAIRCCGSYGARLADEGWRSEIPNKELVRRLYELYRGLNVQFIHIRAHTGLSDEHSMGNENADRLANMAIGLDSCPYASVIESFAGSVTK
jgi:ribonuclease HI